MSVNLLANGGFESGSLSPWFASAPNVAVVETSDAEYTPYSGDYYLNLQTAVGNRGNTASQKLSGLSPGINYTVSLQTRTRGAGAANYCSVYVYGGNNATTGAIANIVDTPNEWTELKGGYMPKTSEDVLNIIAACTFSGSSATGHVLFDEVVFAQ
ncbi:hypothetical protein ASPVEDRAFT_82250 [Aspergillus versicolor CBS 583.65]|uniref:CBM-cenC domain-containing protein n=1 Tax=Aspergillus versicolor CBS 583.65 TaxID=1036611 RepID=A0A1L9PGQ3_ASPVE|nr:uncharacterized protein ASPVEDRAFT_82250 [Aspergillus versicolor CBS 583.65]OJJ00691.1 hypothetical protein ASPVEDRAFT_82250 [Aspergillus versicolor CBS 583.65]